MEASGNRQSEPTIGTIVKNILIFIFVILIIWGLHSSIEDNAIREYRESIYDEVYQEGYNAGYDEGKNNGHHSAYENGLDEGYDEGYEEGYEEGFRKGKSKIAKHILNILNEPISEEECVFVLEDYFKGEASNEDAILALLDLQERFQEIRIFVNDHE